MDDLKNNRLKLFNFDGIFNGNIGSIYQKIGKGMTQIFVQGNNSIAMAYGQTSSGKTTFLGISTDKDKKLF